MYNHQAQAFEYDIASLHTTNYNKGFSKIYFIIKHSVIKRPDKTQTKHSQQQFLRIHTSQTTNI